MPSRHAALLAALAALSLAGCSSSATGSAHTSAAGTSTTTQPTASTPASTSSSPSTHPSSTAAGAPGVPEPARQHTTKGAIAFAKYYIQKINETGMHPKSGVLEPLALDKCRACNSFSNNVLHLKQTHTYNSKNAASITAATRLAGEDGMVIELTVDQMAIDVVNSKGTAVKHYPLIKGIGFVYFLKWTTGGWRISQLKYDTAKQK